MDNEQLIKANELKEEIRRRKEWLEKLEKAFELHADDNTDLIKALFNNRGGYCYGSVEISKSSMKVALIITKEEITQEMQQLEKEFAEL